MSMELYFITTPERAAAIGQQGFQEDDVYYSEYVRLVDVRPGSGGGTLRTSRQVDVHDEGVSLTPKLTTLMDFGDPELIRWLRVHVDLPDEAVTSYKRIHWAAPQGLSPEELEAYTRGINEGTIPLGEEEDYGYSEYLVPLGVLQAHARIEGPFTCEEETDDPTLETTAEPGIDFDIDIEESDGEEDDKDA
jgi:hypothetical protein